MPHSLVSPNSYKKRKEKHIERHETRLEGECLYRLYYDYTMYEADILIKGSCTKYIIYPILQSKLDIISKYIVLLIVKKFMLIPLQNIKSIWRYLALKWFSLYLSYYIITCTIQLIPKTTFLQICSSVK